jgi:hypothetical protein
MCSLIIDKIINCFNQYEYSSLVEFSYFNNIKKIQNIIRFINYNKYKNIDSFSRE